MDDNIKKGIIQTLTYFDIFDYPLTLPEIKKFNHCKINLSDSALLDIIMSIPIIQESSGYYYFLGRSEIVAKRQEKEETSSQKFGKAWVVSKILSKIPLVEYVGIAGNLAFRNSSVNDDIELLIVTSPNSLWITRFFVNIFLKILKQSRDEGNRKGNLIVPTIYLDKANLLLPINFRNSYYANLLVNLLTLYTKNNTDLEIINSNKWVLENLPNTPMSLVKRKKNKKIFTSNITKIINKFTYSFFNNKNSKLKKQHKYNFAVFESINKQSIILDLYDLKLKKYLNLFEDDMWIESEEAKFYLDEKKVRILN